MSTRGTYSFTTMLDWQPEVCLYVHQDNYELGAAVKLFKALHHLKEKRKNRDWRGNLSSAFMRANLSAEFTRSHDSHDDTDYQYSIVEHTPKDIVLLIEKTNREFVNGKMESSPSVIYSGQLVDFLVQQLLKHKEEDKFLSENWDTTINDNTKSDRPL